LAILYQAVVVRRLEREEEVEVVEGVVNEYFEALVDQLEEVVVAPLAFVSLVDIVQTNSFASNHEQWWWADLDDRCFQSLACVASLGHWCLVAGAT
jgi:hypothetical protein